MMESLVAKVLGLKDALPAVRRQIFESIYQQGSTPEACAQALGLTPEQFSIEHGAMLRSLRLGTSQH